MSTLVKFAAHKTPQRQMGANFHKLSPKIKWQQLFLGMRPQGERERKTREFSKNLFIRTVTIFQRVQQIFLLSAHAYLDDIYSIYRIYIDTLSTIYVYI